MSMCFFFIRCVIEELKSLGKSHAESYRVARRDYKLARFAFHLSFFLAVFNLIWIGICFNVCITMLFLWVLYNNFELVFPCVKCVGLLCNVMLKSYIKCVIFSVVILLGYVI